MAIMALVAPAPALAEDVDITFLLLSDIYEMNGTGKRGGFGRAAAVARQERAKNGNLLYVHAGDTLSPSLMSGIDMGKHVVELLNTEPLDVFVPGNHEFDFGAEVFKNRILNELDADIFAANMRDGAGKAIAGILDAKIYDFAGVKVGVYGLLAESTPELSSPGNDYRFLPVLESAAATSAALRDKGADLVVAVVHDSFAVDYALMDKGVADIILSGHDHSLNIQYDGKVVLAETRSEADYMIAVDVRVSVTEKKGKRKIRWWPNFRIIDTAEFAPTADAANLLAKYEARLAKTLGQKIGTTATALDSRRASVRGSENAFGNLIADATRELVNADVAIINGGGIRADKQYDPGTALSRRDILSELPFGNTVVKLEVTGAQLRAALENGVSQVEDGAGRFPHVAGLSMSVNTNATPGSRLLTVTVGGQPLDDNAIYSLGTNSYMASGGDGYVSLAEGKVLLAGIDTQLLATAVIGYIEARGTVSPKIEGRIKL